MEGVRTTKYRPMPHCRRVWGWRSVGTSGIYIYVRCNTVSPNANPQKKGRKKSTPPLLLLLVLLLVGLLITSNRAWLGIQSSQLCLAVRGQRAYVS